MWVDMVSRGDRLTAPTRSDRQRQRWRRGSLLAVVILLLIVIRPAWHLLTTAWNDDVAIVAVPAGQVDDASQLNRTAVAEVVEIPVRPEQSLEQLARILTRAREQKLRVSIAGARHSMGGHTIFPGGIAINMLSYNRVELASEPVSAAADQTAVLIPVRAIGSMDAGAEHRLTF